MKAKIGIFHLTMIGLSGLIGSGWLFASMYTAKLAGSGAFIAWIIGALLMLVFCLCMSELVSLYPRRGLLASICSYSHNKDFSFIISLSNWFGTLAVIPTEALATTRYLGWPYWTNILLIIGYALLNTWGAKLFARFNSVITVFKFIVPLLTIIMLFSHGVHWHHFHPSQMLNIPAIMTAVIAGGVVYGFNGVQLIANFSSEAKKPSRDIPVALFLSLGIGLILYLLLQAAFINTANLSVNYNSPFIELAVSLNIGWLVMLLKADAAISPSGTGFSYIGSTTRMLTAMSREGQLPKGFNVLHPKYHISHRSLFMNTLIAVIFLAIFKTWIGLVVVVSSFHVISYLAGPLALGKLRLSMPHEKRVFNMPLYWLLCPLLFIVLSVLFVLAGYANDFKITIICLAFQGLYLFLNYRGAKLIRAISRSAFLPMWLVIFTLLAHVDLNIYEVSFVALLMYYTGVGRGESTKTLKK